MSDIDDIWDDDEDRDQFAVTVVDQRERAVEFATAREEIESLRQQLATALAACKAKDDIILEVLECASTTRPPVRLREALAIQPDDSALMAWLGEPVGYISNHLRYVLERSAPYIPMAIEMSVVNLNWPNQIQLYSPKGMT